MKLEFSISDTGIGMTQSQVESIFNSYYQGDDSTSREFGGTGLGLAISKELVELMGGEIHVSSQKDLGTTFSFTVNFTLKDAQNQRQYRLPSSSMLEKKVLIVDSSNRNVIPLVKSLGYFNYVVNAISSFEDAVLRRCNAL
ncbi:MAG: ATP-binding protein [Sulfurimonas sp.]|nr:ATP-binding protein [Sulfurimonas sp.]